MYRESECVDSVIRWSKLQRWENKIYWQQAVHVTNIFLLKTAECEMTSNKAGALDTKNKKL